MADKKAKLVRIFVPDKSGWTFLTLACTSGETAAQIRDKALERIRKKRLAQKAEQADPMVERLLDADPESLFLERRWDPKLKMEPLILPQSTLIEPLITSDPTKLSIFLTIPPQAAEGAPAARGGGEGVVIDDMSPASPSATHTNFFGMPSAHNLSPSSKSGDKGLAMLRDTGFAFTRYSADPREPTSSVNLFYTTEEGKLGVLFWCPTNKPKERDSWNQVKLDKLTDVCLGKKTAILRSDACQGVSEDRCVSLHTRRNNVHLSARNAAERDLFVSTLRSLLSNKGQTVNLRKYDDRKPDEIASDIGVNRHAEGVTSPLSARKPNPSTSSEGKQPEAFKVFEVPADAWSSIHDRSSSRTFADYDDIVESDHHVALPSHAPPPVPVSTASPGLHQRGLSSSAVSAAVPNSSSKSGPTSQPHHHHSASSGGFMAGAAPAAKRPLPRGVTFHRLKPSMGAIPPVSGEREGEPDPPASKAAPHVYDV